MPAGVAHALAAGVGALLWVATTVASGQREAWDSPFYWTIAYPAGLVFAALLGYAAPERPWRWALTLMLVQPLVMVLMEGAGNMLPLGLVLFGFLALPGMLFANLVAGLRRRLETGTARRTDARREPQA